MYVLECVFNLEALMQSLNYYVLRIIGEDKFFYNPVKYVGLRSEYTLLP